MCTNQPQESVIDVDVLEAEKIDRLKYLCKLMAGQPG